MGLFSFFKRCPECKKETCVQQPCIQKPCPVQEPCPPCVQQQAAASYINTTVHSDNHVSIACPSGFKPEILKATYGPRSDTNPFDLHKGIIRDPRMADFTSIAQSLNQSTTSGVYQVERIFDTAVGDPAGGVHKDIVLSWKCEKQS